MNAAQDPLRKRIIESDQPVGAADRGADVGALLLLAGGGLLAGVGLFKLLQIPRSWPGLLATGIGGALLVRGLRELPRSARNPRPLESPGPDPEVNAVDEALWESFPASDPPAPRHVAAW